MVPIVSELCLLNGDEAEANKKAPINSGNTITLWSKYMASNLRGLSRNLGVDLCYFIFNEVFKGISRVINMHSNIGLNTNKISFWEGTHFFFQKPTSNLTFVWGVGIGSMIVRVVIGVHRKTCKKDRIYWTQNLV